MRRGNQGGRTVPAGRLEGVARDGPQRQENDQTLSFAVLRADTCARAWMCRSPETPKHGGGKRQSIGIRKRRPSQPPGPRPAGRQCRFTAGRAIAGRNVSRGTFSGPGSAKSRRGQRDSGRAASAPLLGSRGFERSAAPVV